MINYVCRFVLFLCVSVGFVVAFVDHLLSLWVIFHCCYCCAESVVVQYTYFFGGSGRVLHNMLAQIAKASVVSSRQAIRGSGFILSKRAYHEKVNEAELNPLPPHAPLPPPQKKKQTKRKSTLKVCGYVYFLIFSLKMFPISCFLVKEKSCFAHPFSFHLGDPEMMSYLRSRDHINRKHKLGFEEQKFRVPEKSISPYCIYASL
jgi:hypothetical protein